MLKERQETAQPNSPEAESRRDFLTRGAAALGVTLFSTTSPQLIAATAESMDISRTLSQLERGARELKKLCQSSNPDFAKIHDKIEALSKVLFQLSGQNGSLSQVDSAKQVDPEMTKEASLAMLKEFGDRMLGRVSEAKRTLSHPQPRTVKIGAEVILGWLSHLDQVAKVAELK